MSDGLSTLLAPLDKRLSTIAALGRPDLTMGQRVLLARLVWYADRSGTAWPKHQTLATDLGRSVAWVRKALTALHDKGYLASRRRMRHKIYVLAFDELTGEPLLDLPAAREVIVEEARHG